jgi:SulP family sulfate permease
LQGFVFFGTANRLYQQVRERLQQEGVSTLRYVLLDFRQVTGLDASAVMSFPKIKQYVESHGIKLVFSNLLPELQTQLERDYFADLTPEQRLMFHDLDHAVEWCEDQEIDRLQSVGLGPSRRGSSAAMNIDPERTVRFSRLSSFFEDSAEDNEKNLFERLMPFLERLELPPGQRFIEQGRRTEGLYFIQEGSTTAEMRTDGGKVKRLRKTGSGSVVGEVSLYMNQVATADVVTNSTCVIFLLSREKLREMEEQEPRLAQELHKFLARLLSYRLATSTDTVRALMG